MTASTSSGNRRRGSGGQRNAGQRGAEAPAFLSRLPSFLAVAAILIVWQYASAAVGAPIILPDPETTLKKFIELIADEAFRRSVGISAFRVFAGFSLSVAAGMLIGVPAGIESAVRSAFGPVLAIIRTTPIMSVILIALLWFETGTVPVFSAFLIGFPVVVQNVIAGIRQTDTRLIEMGSAYGFTARRMLTAVYIPSVVPYLVSGAQTALGLTWKVVVAAEVLSLPRHGIGAKMQYAQMSLETAEVFAWTAVAIICAGVSHMLLSQLLRLFPWRSGGADTV
jgi:NitT/TauT family transport system permease protein